MTTIKRLLKLVRRYHIWDNYTGTGEVFWLTPRRAKAIAASGYCVTEVK